MALVQVTLSNAMAKSASGTPTPIPNSQEVGSKTVSSSGTSATVALTGRAGQIWTISSAGSIYVKFGSSPVAAADSGWIVMANETRDFVVTVDGETVAIKDTP